MIVCSCNVLSDLQIRNAVTGSRERELSAQQVYECSRDSSDTCGCTKVRGTCSPRGPVSVELAGVGEAGIDLFVELVDDLDRRVARRANAIQALLASNLSARRLGAAW